MTAVLSPGDPAPVPSARSERMTGGDGLAAARRIASAGGTSSMSISAARSDQARSARSVATDRARAASPSVTATVAYPISGRSSHGCTVKTRRREYPVVLRRRARDHQPLKWPRQRVNLRRRRGHHRQLGVGHHRPHLAREPSRQQPGGAASRLPLIDMGTRPEPDDGVRLLDTAPRDIGVEVHRHHHRHAGTNALAHRREKRPSASSSPSATIAPCNARSTASTGPAVANRANSSSRNVVYASRVTGAPEMAKVASSGTISCPVASQTSIKPATSLLVSRMFVTISSSRQR